MFRKTNPQKPLFSVDSQMSESSRGRLKSTWAEVFRTEILPILMSAEDGFSILYGETGRPNFSVGRLLGLCLLQELNNLADEAALDAFQFDRRWQYALDIGAGEDLYLSRRSLVEFRRRLALKDPDMRLMRDVFERISKAAIKRLGISHEEQRLDSTHIASNIHTRSRLDLFQKTLRHFLNSLNEKQFARVPARIRKWHKEEPAGWFGLGSATKNRQKLIQLAGYAHRLLRVFEGVEEVTRREEYRLLGRLVDEQCEPADEDPSDSGSSGGEGAEPIKVKKKATGTLLDSPYDPDASYGHKGIGYSVHVAETCQNAEKHEIITTFEVHGAARSDMGKASEVLNRLDAAGLKPSTLYADGGYPSVPSCHDIFSRGTELIAPLNRARLADEVMGRDRFEFDREGRVKACPMGVRPVDHRAISNSNSKGVKIPHAIFKGDTCRQCDQLERCPVRAPNHRARGCKPRDTVGDFRLEITPALNGTNGPGE